MRILRSQDGAALVTALMLTMMALVISLALLYSVINETKISASQKRYRTALAAAQGGVEVLTRELIPRLFQSETTKDSLESAFSDINLKLPQYDCLQQKLNSPTAEWNKCSPQQASADPEESPDATFKLSGILPAEKGFVIATKIVDSVPGNSDTSSAVDYLDPGSSVAGTDAAIHPQHVPGLYNIAVQGAREGSDSREKARLSVLYAY
jgi:hypothetical protein